MTKYKRITAIVLSLALVIILGGEIFLSTFIVSASENVQSFDDTSIESDLINIDLSNYPANPLGESEIISFMEYAYSDNAKLSKYFGIYVYVYNPTKKLIVQANGYNTVNIAVCHSENDQEKFSLQDLTYVSKTDDNLFYKFKLTNSSSLLPSIQEYSEDNEGTRRYELIELQIRHGQDIESVAVDKTYEWTGYAAYCGPDGSEISNLECKDFGARSIHLNLQQTNYRFEEKKDGTYTCDELNSVLFSIPEEFFYDFGNLNSIRAEWYEYKTDYMFVTSDFDAYSAMWDFRNYTFNKYGKIDSNQRWVSVASRLYYRVFWEESVLPTANSGTYYYFKKTFNAGCLREFENNLPLGDIVLHNKLMGGVFYLHDDVEWVDSFAWLFYTDKVSGEDAYEISKSEVEDYMNSYTRDFPNQELIRGKFASSLFADSIDEDRLQFLEGNTVDNIVNYSGHVVMDFYAGVDFDKNQGNLFVDTDKSQSAWNKFWFGTKYKDYTYSPIQVVKETDLVLDANTFAEKYYINEKDASAFLQLCKEAYKNNERPVLLRFAVTDYYSSAARFDYGEHDSSTYEPTNKVEMSEQDGYVAQETMFFDFDIISLGFKSDEGYNDVIIGVVATPIDVINGLTPPDGLVQDQEWWQILVMLLGIIIIIVLLSFIVPFAGPVFSIIIGVLRFALSLVINIALLPFKLIFSLFRRRR